MHIQARRIFRLSFTPALALAIAYGSSNPLPYIAPLFAFFLTMMPGPPLGTKKLAGLIILLLLTLGVGLLLIPMLMQYQITALLLVLLGLYLSSYLSVNLSKNLPGTFLAMGITIISAAGTVSYSLAAIVIQSLVFSIITAALCHSLIYLLFPEDPADRSQSQTPPADIKNAVQSNWIAIRSTLIVFPAYLLLLTNPAMYMPIAMKSVMLSQQASTMDAKSASHELIGSTLLGGLFAILFWFALGLWTNLWMFFFVDAAVQPVFFLQNLSVYSHSLPGFILAEHSRYYVDHAGTCCGRQCQWKRCLCCFFQSYRLINFNQPLCHPGGLFSGIS